MIAKHRILAVRRASRVIRLTILLACLCYAGSSAAQTAPAVKQAPPSKNVLFLLSYGYGSRGVELFNDNFITEMNASGVKTSDLFFEYLDLGRHNDKESRRQMLSRLKLKYDTQNIDLIVTGQQPALGFLLNDAKSLAPQAPIIRIASLDVV